MQIEIEGKRPQVHASAWVAPNAVIAGDVTIGEEVGIWYGAVVRGDIESIEVGARTNIQDNCVLHADPGSPLVIGTRVSVGHNATLHGCTIGDDVLVGMGSRVLNGATVGAGSLIAAGAVIPEGADIPPGSMVAGVPGKVRRELTKDEQAGIAFNGDVYVDLMGQHANGVVIDPAG
ncbi:gamma carbonic anhydrase family protein [Luteipulveratus mongoliensis]|uniref:Anhydrase n=1 Tax=Luteipulveratus mongoliensis TaxID=571913 RepID=A0A0K1JFQ7_9MICO|nr:gamma carbonic anhydrase family protein [Luteipulveratus mongoliensis]AKU15418.1 anhydrase [Luteipulveratus mongoliensis]